MNLGSDEAVLESIGDRLARFRLRRDWTQAALAEEAGVSVPTVKRMEAGRSTQMTNFVRVLRALDLLEGLESLLPSPRVSPLQALETEGRGRKRASGKRRRPAPRPAPETEPADAGAGGWTWGDEEDDEE